MLMHNPAHPGEVLREFLLGREIGDFAGQIGVARTTLSRILNGHAGITAEMSVRLAEALKTSPELWIGMQMQYDLWHALQARKLSRKAQVGVKMGRSTPLSSARPTRLRKAA